jgi:hypothetical protein
MRLSRRALLAALPLAPTLAQAQALGSGSLAFESLVRQIGGMADISPYLLRAAEYEFDAAYGQSARNRLVHALGIGPLEARMADADPGLKAQVTFLATLLYTGEVTRNGVTKAEYYPWCLAWKALTFATAPGLCGGPDFGHWTNAPINGAM